MISAFTGDPVTLRGARFLLTAHSNERQGRPVTPAFHSTAPTARGLARSGHLERVGGGFSLTATGRGWVVAYETARATAGRYQRACADLLMSEAAVAALRAATVVLVRELFRVTRNQALAATVATATQDCVSILDGIEQATAKLSAR